MLIFFLIMELQDYVRRPNKWCEPHKGKSERTLMRAQEVCSSNKNCRMFYDIKSENKTFVLCGPSSIAKNSNVLASSLYLKCKLLNCNCGI